MVADLSWQNSSWLSRCLWYARIEQGGQLVAPTAVLPKVSLHVPYERIPGLEGQNTLCNCLVFT